VVHDKGKGEKDYRSLKGDDEVLAIGLARALELLAEPKRGRGGRTALKDLGTPPGADDAIQLFNGPYGLYVKQGKLNASLPEGGTAETITLEQAVELLAAKAASGKGSGRARSGKASDSKASGSKASGSKASGSKASSAAAKAAKPASKTPTTTKTGRLRASAVRVIKPAGS
jgi:DNA topoisomerase-1